MKRRTVMRKLGAAGIGPAAISGTAAKPSSTADLGGLSVSSVDGWVTPAELLEPHEIAALPRAWTRPIGSACIGRPSASPSRTAVQSPTRRSWTRRLHLLRLRHRRGSPVTGAE